MKTEADAPAERLATNLRVLSRQAQVLPSLSAFDPIVLKGPYLTLLAYGDLSARASADVDLWVPLRQGPAALRTLLAQGYLPEPGVDAFAQLAAGRQVALWPGRDYSQISVDLHVAPFRPPYFRVDERLLFPHTEWAELAGVRFKAPTPELALCHLVSHYVQHHLADEHLALISALAAKLGTRMAAPEFSELVQRSCGEDALSLALARASGARGSSSPLPLTLRAGWVQAALPAPGSGAQPREAVRKLLSLLLVAPERTLQGILGAAFLSQRQLAARYGSGSYPGLLLRHAGKVLRGR